MEIVTVSKRMCSHSKHALEMVSNKQEMHKTYPIA